MTRRNTVLKDFSELKIEKRIEPSQDFIDDCMHWRGRVLTGQWAHWCQSLDFLPVDETCPEWPCDCNFPKGWGNQNDRQAQA